MNQQDAYITDANFSINDKDVSIDGAKRSDYETLYKYETDEAFKRFCLNRLSPLSDLDDFKERFERIYSKQRKFQFMIRDDKQNNLGTIFTSQKGLVHGNSNFCLYLDKSARGNLVIWLAVTMFFRYMFKKMKLIKLYTTVMADNEISLRVVKHFGFVEEAFFPSHYVRTDGNHVDVYIFALYPSRAHKWYKGLN